MFDSILNGYPIGTLIVWNTDKEVPYREFMNDYEDGKIATLVDKSLWERTDKWLVYDGQQRLQTLFSCLKYTLNKRILAYNLLYKSDNTDEDYGFEFIDKNTDNPGYIKLPALFSKTDAEKVSYRKKIQKTIHKNRPRPPAWGSFPLRRWCCAAWPHNSPPPPRSGPSHTEDTPAPC